MTEKQRNFAFLLKTLSRLYSTAFEAASGPLNLTLPQCRVLTQLEREDGVTQVRLAEQTEMDPMTLMRLLDRMEQDQWVERRQDPQDRRTKRLYLQAAATPILEQIYRFSDRVRAAAMAGLDDKQRRELIQMLEHVNVNLTSLTSADGLSALQNPADMATKPSSDKQR